jgi:hypothetical protein
MNMPRRCLIVFLCFTAWAASSFGQTPSSVITIRAVGFRQTSATAQAVFEPSYLISVDFPASVSTSTVVQLRGPVTLTFTRTSPTQYEATATFSTEQQLDAALPGGNYTLAVSGGGPASNTILTLPPRPAIPPSLILNFDELQALTSGTFRVQWQPIASDKSVEVLYLNVYRGEAEIFSSEDTAQISAGATDYAVTNLPIAPGETVTGTLGYVRVTVSSANGGATTIGHGTGVAVEFPITRLLVAPPIIFAQPQSITVGTGSTAVFNVQASGEGLRYQWRDVGAIVQDGPSSMLVLNDARPAVASTYHVVVSNAAGSVTSSPATLSVAAGGAPSRIVNLAIRAAPEDEASPLIVGFVIGGSGTTGTKPMLVRAVGPSLGSFGVSGVVADPQLRLFSGSSPYLENDNWGGDAQVVAVSANVGAFPLSALTSRDASVYIPTLAREVYTMHIRSVGGSSGVALAEVYDATPPTSFSSITPRLVNVSARSRVSPGSNLIAGFVISGPVARTVLIRGVGGALARFGIASRLLDPRLTLFNGPTKLLENDNWDGNQSLTEISRNVGAFDISAAPRDAVLLATLPPGNYTAQVNGINNSSGVALVEVFEVP